MNTSNVFLCLFATLAIVGCNKSQNSQSVTPPKTLKDIQTDQVIIFTPSSTTDDHGRVCFSYSGSATVTQTNSAENGALAAQKVFDAHGNGVEVYAELDRNGSLKNSRIQELGDWDSSGIPLEDIPSALFEDFDLSDFENDQAPAKPAEDNADDPFDMVVENSLTGNIFQGGSWAGPLGKNPVFCSGTWSLEPLEEYLKAPTGADLRYQFRPAVAKNLNGDDCPMLYGDAILDTDDVSTVSLTLKTLNGDEVGTIDTGLTSLALYVSWLSTEFPFVPQEPTSSDNQETNVMQHLFVKGTLKNGGEWSGLQGCFGYWEPRN